MIPEKPFYRPDELAAIAEVSPKTVQRWLREGQIEHIHLGRVLRIPRAQMVRILAEGLDKKRGK